MTKTDEIKLLDQTIAKFGPQSYIGPWLQEYRNPIAAAIQSDFSPEANAILPAEAYRQARDIIAAAKAEAADIRAKANRDAEQMTIAAAGRIESAKANARVALQRLSYEV